MASIVSIVLLNLFCSIAATPSTLLAQNEQWTYISSLEVNNNRGNVSATSRRKRLSIKKTLAKIALLIYCVNDLHNFYTGALRNGSWNALSKNGLKAGCANTNTIALYHFTCTMLYLLRGIYRGGYWVTQAVSKITGWGQKGVQ